MVLNEGKTEDQSVSQQCRLCGDVTANDQQLFSLFDDSAGQSLLLAIEKYLSIKLGNTNDVLPKTLCQSCLEQIHRWRDFYDKCHAAQIFFSNVQQSPSNGRKTAEPGSFPQDVRETTEHKAAVLKMTRRKDQENERGNQEEGRVSEVHGEMFYTDNPSCSDVEEPGYSDSDLDSDNSPYDENYSSDDSVTAKQKPRLKSRPGRVRRQKFKFTLDYLERKMNRKFTKDESSQLQRYISNGQNTLIYEMLVGGGPEQSWQCQVCGKTVIGRAAEAQKHYERVHRVDPVLPCHVCDYTSRTEKMYQAHRMSHLIEYPCDRCGKVFTQHSRLVYHMNSHKNERQYECDLCSKKFNMLQYLATHKRKVHGDQEELLKYTCELCGMRFKYKNHLVYHQKRHPTNENPLPYSCKYCDERFLTRAEQLAHSNTIHAEEGDFVCEVCGKKMKTSLSLQNHVKLHSGIKEFKCDICDAAFATDHSLKCHRKIHDRPAKQCLCPVCGKAMSNKSSLNQHIKTHLGTKPFQCPHCDSSFIHKNRLDIHMRKHTGEQPHICVDCGKAFRSASSMNSHRQYVHSERRFACSVCGKAFKTSRDLKTHATLHTGEKPNICNICGKAFRVRANYFKHRKIHIKAAQQPMDQESLAQVTMIAADPAISEDPAANAATGTDFFQFAPEQQWSIV